MWKQHRFPVSEHSHVGEVRRAAQVSAQDMGLEEILVGKISIVATELATNIVKHAGSGEIFLIEAPKTLHILAIDKGPGMNPDVCLNDGFSTGGTQGTGLGAIKRAATRFDLFTTPGNGAVIYASFCSALVKAPFIIGALNVPYHGEIVSGDSWSCHASEDGFQLLVADGLGHGLMANEASQLAVKIFEEEPVKNRETLFQTLHLALRSTRGAAVSLATYDKTNRVINFIGVGNVLGMIAGPGVLKKCISYNGTLGVQTRKIQTLPYPMEKDSYFFLMSDGISTQSNLADYPGVFNRHPFILAALIYRDFGKDSDDATVVVFKENE